MIWISSEFHFYVSGYRPVFVIPVWDSSGFLKLRTCAFQQYWTSIGCSTFPKFRLFHPFYPLLLAFVYLLYVYFAFYTKIFLALFSIPDLLSFTFPSLFSISYFGFSFFSDVSSSLLSPTYLWLTPSIDWFFKINSYIFNFLKFCLILIKYAWSHWYIFLF